MDSAELANRFAYHKPESSWVAGAHEKTRHVHSELAEVMNSMLPESREKSLCLTALQESMMWANAAIAIHGLEGPV